MTKPNFVTNPLSILYSTRIRLTEDERNTLKTAHNAFRAGHRVAEKTPVMAGSGISVETATDYTASSYAQAGLSSLIVSDLITSRDSISIAILLKVEALLGVKVLKRKVLEQKFQEYLDYLGVE